MFATTTIAGWLGGMRDAFTGMNASWREYAANAIASEGAIVAKKLSVTEQILASDQARRDSIALESELRQDSMSREIAANQKLMIELEAVKAARDDLRNQDFQNEVATLEKKLAVNESYLGKLMAEEVAHMEVLKEAQIQMALANNRASGLQPGSQEAAEALATVYKNEQAEKSLALTREQIIFETQRVAVLNEEIASTRGLMVAEQLRSDVEAGSTARMVEKNAALATGIRAEREAVAGMSAMSAGAAELKAGIMGLQFAFNALGGWLTVLAAGIVGGIALWNQFGEAAKRAANAALDAANLRRSIAQGNVSQSQLEQADSHIDDKKAQIAQLQNQLGIAQKGQRVDSGFQGPDPEAAATIRAQIDKEKAALSDLIAMRAQAQKDVDASNVKLVSAGYARKYEQDSQEEVDAIAKASQNEQAAIRQRYSDLQKTLSPDAYKEAQKKEALELQAAIQKGTKDISAAYDARYKELTAKINSVSGPDAANQKAALEQERMRIAQQMNNSAATAAAEAGPNDILSGKNAGHVSAPTDGLEKQLERVKVQLAAAKGQLREIVTGATEYDDLRADAEAKVREMWEGGKLDTKTHGKNGTTTRPDFNSSQVQGLIDDETMLTIVNNAKSQMTQLKSKLAPMVAEYNDTMGKLMAGDFTTTAGKEDNSTLKFLEKLSVKSQDAAKDLAPVIATIKATKLAADQLDLANFARGIGKADQATQLSLISSPVDRMKAQFAQENAEWDAEAQIKIQKVKELGGQVDAAQAIIDAARTDRMKLQAKQLETPMQQMVDSWQNATDEMQKASANWGNSTIDMFVNSAKTGKLEWKSLVESILTDMLKISLQKSLGNGLQKGFDALAGWAGNLLGGNKQSDAASVSPTGSASAGIGMTNAAGVAVQQFGTKLLQASGLADKFGFSLGDKASQLTTSLTTDVNTTNSMAALTNAAYAAANALASIAGGGGGSSGFGSAIASIAGAALSAYVGGDSSATTGMLSQTSSMGSSSTLMGVQGGTNTLGNWNYTGGQMSNQYNFADGGIMTEFGPLSLRKYANGGIADTPQVAVYGEGSMNEAFVPLPDGRSIPVTIMGGQQQGSASGPSNIVVNVINQSGQAVEGKQQGSPRFDGKQMILDVVLQAATSPGTFRDQMKGAMKS
ncbi:phage tail tape measure C-terminal domain-containing protein [Paraburkholderia sp. RCC_158]|uniref:phage tail tape measure C-terminal domain-containing protein n=1 Tax=Paraburkholderia sp. RCC_158 TaxID=3239220 RepID=UPI00352330E4